MRVLAVPPRVPIDNKASAAHTVIEVNGRDRPALLFDLTRALTSLGVQIAGAKIATYGEKLVDAFFVKDLFGLKIDHESKLTEIRKTLFRVLEVGEAPRPREAVRGGVGVAWLRRNNAVRQLGTFD